MTDEQCKISTLLEEGAKLPQYGTEESAGADVYAIESFELEPNKSLLVDTQISIAIPKGFVGLITSRSGLALKSGIIVLNSPGIIDSDYRGKIGIILFNTSSQKFVAEKLTRIAQLIILKYEKAEFLLSSDLPSTERGFGGFGSTGLK